MIIEMMDKEKTRIPPKCISIINYHKSDFPFQSLIRTCLKHQGIVTVGGFQNRKCCWVRL